MSEEKRKYQKKNAEYWKNLQRKIQPPVVVQAKLPTLDLENVNYIEGAADTSYSRSGSSFNVKRTGTLENRFPYVEDLGVPFEDRNETICVSKAIELCQKIYFNIAYFRNTIEAMTEFSCTPIHIKCKNKTVKTFIEKWLTKIDIHSLQEQFFREYYRSGNVFIYKFLGEILKKDLDKLESLYGAAPLESRIPIKYVILNPINIGVETALFTSYSFIKIFNQFEIYRLQNPKTDIERQIVESLPALVKAQLKNSSSPGNYVYMPLDPQRLSYVFYKKQDYEPLAVPLGYSVLDDIEHKLALKKMDRIMAKTVENVILLITMGAKPEEGGINQENIKAVYNLFKTPAAARVFVSDYTTEADFIVPKLENILGPEKYAEVDKDIKEGLQNALLGESKFADTMIKTKMFIERLQEGQQIFLDRFLLPEIYKVCDSMNFKNYPTATFEKIKLEDANIANKVITRLLELGILVPSDGIQAMETGIYPDKETNDEHQTEYKKQRDKGLYMPLVGGSKEKEAGRPTGSKAPKSSNKVGIRKASISIEDYGKVVRAADDLLKLSQSLFKENGGNPDGDLPLEVAKYVVLNTSMADWETTLKQCYANKSVPKVTDLSEEISEAAEELELDDYSTALVWHAQKLSLSTESGVTT